MSVLTRDLRHNNTLSSVLRRFRQLFTSPNEVEEPDSWQLLRRTSDETKWWNDDTNQLLVCKRHRKAAWTARAKPALVDGEEVYLSLTAGPTSRHIAEFLAEQYMTHELVLAPVTAMQPRRLA